MQIKTCSKCNRNLDFLQFRKEKNGKNGLRAECKECQDKRSKDKQYNTPEQRKKWRENNKINATLTYWKQRAYRINDRCKNLYNNLDKVFGEDLKRLYEENPKCFYCECELKTSEVEFDHVISMNNGGSNLIDNMAISCKRCNSIKSFRNCTKTDDEFFYYIKTVYFNLLNRR